ncbi:cellular nucleic acid-binding protein-like [Limulus polyphemus]|uniref:Cellular nucleic acid-binding protein-like n=1 Tax=Limulus polyphemus TaxID=6850 RepID=A0ABM1BJN5_LIMPO|nr:cellular nucleic acid-binding protein-like [Limulus polyphemus]
MINKFLKFADDIKILDFDGKNLKSGMEEKDLNILVEQSHKLSKQYAVAGDKANPSDTKTQNKSDSFQCYNCGKVGHMAKNCFKKSKRNEQTVCYNCGITGHMARDCRHPRKQERQNCYNCGKVGHMAKNCFKKSKRNEQTVYYNCGITGHMAHDCRRPRKAENGKAPKAGTYERRFTNSKPTFSKGPKNVIPAGITE